MYCTPAQFVDAPEMLNELSELYQIATALLAATIAGAPRDEWTPEEIAAADAALTSVQGHLVGAAAEVDARLVKRGYVLPLSAAQFPVLTTWSLAIARYHLNPQRERTDETTGRVERDYRNAIRDLNALANGDLSLGPEDPLARRGGPAFCAPERQFTQDTLRDY